MITKAARRRAEELAATAQLPAYVYDLEALAEHAEAIQDALTVPGAPELFYAAKANPDARSCGRSNRTSTESRSPRAASWSMCARCDRSPATSADRGSGSGGVLVAPIVRVQKRVGVVVIAMGSEIGSASDGATLRRMVRAE